MKSKTRTSSLPPIKNNSTLSSSKKIKEKPSAQRIGNYINKSMKYIENGCYEDGKLKIDGNIGDYRMSIFRLKDRNKRIYENPTSFTKQFVKDITSVNPQLKSEFQKIVQSPNQKYLAKENEEEEIVAKFKPLKWQAEEQQHLLYQYLPTYQKQKWFTQTVDNSQSHEPAKLQLREQKIQRKRFQKKTNNRKFIFRFLQPNSGIF